MGNSHKLEQYRVEVGDTERSAEEIVRDIRSHGEPIVQVTLDAESNGLTAAGSIINIEVTPHVVDEESLKKQLNEAGGCMYQVISVAKLS